MTSRGASTTLSNKAGSVVERVLDKEVGWEGRMVDFALCCGWGRWWCYGGVHPQSLLRGVR
jgi:hypothetical protein